MKKIYTLIAALFILSVAALVIAFKLPISHPFLPAALLHNGEPIHPSCIAAMQFFGSDAIEPKHVDCLHVKPPPGFSDTVERDNIKENIVSIDPKHKEILARMEIRYPGNEHQYFLDESYTYLTTYRDNHVLIIKTEGLGSGRYTALAFVRREGDYIVNAGTILMGDRAEAGSLYVEEIKDNMLRIRYSNLYCGLINYVEEGLADSINGLPCWLFSLGFYTIAEVDMNYRAKSWQERIKLLEAGGGIEWPEPVEVGLEFCDKDHYTSIKHEERAAEEKCFNDLALQYIDAGHIRLNIDEARGFAIKVGRCIDKK